MTQTLFIVILSVYAGSLLLIPLAILAWNLRVVYRPGYHRFIFTDDDDVLRSVMKRLEPGQTQFDMVVGGKAHTYGLDNECVRYSGRFRLPTYEYIVGIAEPLNIGTDELRLSSKIAATDFNNVARNTAMSQLIAAMRKGIVNPTNIVIVTTVIIVVVVAASGIYLATELNTIKEHIGVN